MKIAKIAGRGLGVLSTRYLKPGQLILQEMPFARVNKDAGSAESRANPKVAKLMARVLELASTGQFDPRSEYGSWPSEVVHCFEGVLEAQADMVFEGHATDDKQKTPGGIIRTNGVDDAEDHANLYTHMSRMNHSCAPNAVRVSTGDSGGVAVVARKQIDEGEEVMINYMDGADDGKPVEQRRKHLMQQYTFHCTCPLCMSQETK